MCWGIIPARFERDNRTLYPPKVLAVKKYLIALIAVAGALGIATFTHAQSYHDEIAKRIAPIGSVCLKGEPCEGASAAGAAQMADSASAGMADPEAIYNQSCATCHEVGVAGAPKFADQDAWAPRIDKGMDTLYSSVINGLPPGMPAKGLCMTCSEEELKAVTDYMIAAAEG